MLGKFPSQSVRVSKNEDSCTHVNHTHSSLLILGDDPESLFVDDAVGSSTDIVSPALVALYIGIEQVTGVVRLEPFAQELELAIIGGSLRQGD
jgi:hypothetical protein